MNLAIVGTGYVGLVTGTCFAETGNNVICVDKDRGKIEKLKNGIIPIYEPGLEPLIKKNVEAKRLFFTTDMEYAVINSEIIFLAVGTPPDEDGSADLSYVISAAEEIAKYMDGYKIIVTKSTVPVGTGDILRERIGKITQYDFDVASNPEFLKEGSAVLDCLKPERVIIGAEKEETAKILKELYAPFVRTGNPIYVMDIKSAETTKYAANAMLATRISFMNEFARFCERVGADIESIRLGIGSDSRIGRKFLFPGTGYGGSCFPKDVKAIIQTASEYGYDMKILRAVEDVNNTQKKVLVEKVLKHYGNDIGGKKFSIWGLSFKPNTDDIREAPSIVIISELLKLGAVLNVHDPVAIENVKKVFGDKINYSNDCYDTLKDSEGLLLVTEWNEYRSPDFEKILNLMKSPVIFDGRNIFDKSEVISLGFTYYGIGR